MKKEVLIIGGGASGLLSAIVAKDNGALVAVIEGGNRVARKVLTTGNGRCNFTNKQIKPPYNTFHSSNEGFYTNVLNQLTVIDTLNLFYTYGLTFVELEKGKVYPESLQASSVLDILRLNIEERAIPVFLDTKVEKIGIKGTEFIIETNNPNYKTFSAERVLIACGGSAAKATGSDGSIYNVVSKLGHKIIRPLPGIVQIKLDYKHLTAISGVRFDALASIIVDGKVERTDFEEVLFTDYGISGPAILQISRNASIGLSENKDVRLRLDFYKDKSLNELITFFEGHFNTFGYRSVYNSLIGMINKKLLPIILKDCGIDNIHKTCDSLSHTEIRAFCKLLKGWEFKVTDTNGFNNAQTTIGGIDTIDINENTLESKLVKGLFFSGEVLDVDGDCGGFNLQWAWSSGYVAGKNIARKK